MEGGPDAVEHRGLRRRKRFGGVALMVELRVAARDYEFKAG
jgi:hypothetical protein